MGAPSATDYRSEITGSQATASCECRSEGEGEGEGSNQGNTAAPIARVCPLTYFRNAKRML